MFSFFALLTRPVAYSLVLLSIVSAASTPNPLMRFLLPVVIIAVVVRARRKQASLSLVVAGVVISILTGLGESAVGETASQQVNFCGPALGMAGLAFLISRAALSPAGFSTAVAIDETRRANEQQRRHHRAAQQHLRGEIDHAVRTQLREEAWRRR